MAKKKKNYIPLPIKVIDQFERKYSADIWEKGKNVELDFDPVNAFLEKEYGSTEKDIARTNDHEKYIALKLWKEHKVVYQFDTTLAEELFAQGRDMEVPVEVLLHLPYPCFFIQWSEDEGMFVRGYQDFLSMFMINPSNKNDVYTFPLIKGKSITKSVLEGRRLLLHSLEEKYKKQFKDYKSVLESSEKMINQMFGREYIEQISKYLQLILYLLADNKDMEKLETPPATKIQTNKKRIKNTTEVKKWNVGFRIGSSIRKLKQEEQEKSIEENSVKEIQVGKQGTKKRPHVRKAHWHHYWTGAKDGAERKIILKWIGPTFVNVNKEEQNIPTIHEVRKG